MKVLYLNITNFFASKDMLDALENYRDDSGASLDVIRYPYTYREEYARNDPEFESVFINDLKKYSPDFVFSFNFLPVVSKICNRTGIIYVSWVYSNPELFLYSYHIINKCNIVLMFDSKQFEIFRHGGINTVEYLPLAVSVKRLNSMIPDEIIKKRFDADISFVGSLYTERIQYYEQIKSKVDPYTLGYIDGLIRAQLQVYGLNFIEESLIPEILDDIQQASNINPRPDSAETREYIYANYILNRRATTLERTEILTLIGANFPLKLYTYTQNKAFNPPGVENMGPADYFEEMPYIFKCSRINLNITLRSIQNGIPLRAYDIMGSGGFLLSNYQTDLCRHFISGEDFIYFEDRSDLLGKIKYYLSHDDERMAIAVSAHDKVSKYHTFDVRVKQIIDMVKSKQI